MKILPWSLCLGLLLCASATYGDTPETMPSREEATPVRAMPREPVAPAEPGDPKEVAESTPAPPQVEPHAKGRERLVPAESDERVTVPLSPDAVSHGKPQVTQGLLEWRRKGTDEYRPLTGPWIPPPLPPTGPVQQ